MKHYIIEVFGHVQGVGFRHSARQQAHINRIKGFVRNRADGSVYLEIEGKEEDCTRFIRWCQKGPGYGQVENVEYEEGPLKEFIDFSVRY